MNACSSFKRINTKHWVVAREWYFDVFVCLLDIRIEFREIVIDCSHQLEIDKCLIERRISCTLANTQSSAVNNIGAGFDRCDVVGNAKTTVLMTVPVHFDLAPFVSTVFDDFFIDEAQQLLDAVRCHVTTGVTDAKSTSTKFHCSKVNLLHIFWF